MNAGACPLPGELVAYANVSPGLRGRADGAGPQPAGTQDESRARIEAHLAGCAECRLIVAASAMLQAPESAEETALLDRLATPRGAAAEVLRVAAGRAEPGSGKPDSVRRGELVGRLPVGPLESLPAGPPGSVVSAPRASRDRARPRWARLSAILGGAVAAVAALVIGLHPNDPAEVLAEVQDGARPNEMAFSDLPYAPYKPQRGSAGAEARFDRPLRKLLEAEEKARPGASRLLATLYAVRRGAGDVQRAERLLAQAGSDADSENDRAVLLFSQGDLLAALEAVDRALEENPRHRPARFNRALLLARLGFDDSAAEAFEALAHDDANSPWANEARDRAAHLRAPAPRAGAEPSEQRRAAVVALLSADSPAALARARAQIAALPEGLVQDLVRLGEVAARFTPEQLAAHGKLFARYQSLRAQTLEGREGVDAAQSLIHDAANDPLVLVPALQLAAFRLYWRAELREEQEMQLRALHVCRAVGCDAVSEAIAADELAEAAGRDGDYAAAHRLQDRAEALFVASAAELQLGELQQKRAHLLMDEGRLEEATQASILALRTLAPLRTPEAIAARSTAASGAGGVASARHLLRAELELHRGGLALLANTTAADESAELASSIALDEADLGRLSEAKPVLRAEYDRQVAAGHKAVAGRIRATSAALALREGDASTALSESTQALVELGADGHGLAWSEDLQRLHVQRARALLAVRGEAAIPDARAELQAALDGAVKDANGSSDAHAQLVLARRGSAAGAELAALGVRARDPAPDLLLPLEALRGAVFKNNVPQTKLPAHWEQSLPKESCLIAWLPAEDALVRLAITRGASEAKVLPVSRDQLQALIASARGSRSNGALADPRAPTSAEQSLASALYGSLPSECAAATGLWLWVESPLDQLDVSAQPLPGALADRAAVGFVNSLSRLLAPEPAWPPAEALLIDGAEVRGEDGDVVALPASARERSLLGSILGSSLLELSGPGLTPTALLARLPTARLLHASVHGAEGTREGGGSLQLSGELGRLRADEIANAHLPAGSRVVLAACHAASGESGLAIAFARAGALEVASAEGAIDDEAAARWAETFYPALARGLTFAEANREALRREPESGPRAWFVVSK